MTKASTFLLLSITLAGCASTSVTPVSKNQIMISTSAAVACGRTGAQKVASEMAAIETIRRGYQRFIILGANSSSDIRSFTTPITGAYTSLNASTYGNYTYGSAQTTFTGGHTVIYGSNNADMGVLMLNPGDDGFEQGIDAKQELGADWETLVENGVQTCTG